MKNLRKRIQNSPADASNVKSVCWDIIRFGCKTIFYTGFYKLMTEKLVFLFLPYSVFNINFFHIALKSFVVFSYAFVQYLLFEFALVKYRKKDNRY